MSPTRHIVDVTAAAGTRPIATVHDLAVAEVNATLCGEPLTQDTIYTQQNDGWYSSEAVRRHATCAACIERSMAIETEYRLTP